MANEIDELKKKLGVQADEIADLKARLGDTVKRCETLEGLVLKQPVPVPEPELPPVHVPEIGASVNGVFVDGCQKGRKIDDVINDVGAGILELVRDGPNFKAIVKTPAPGPDTPDDKKSKK